MRLGQLSRKLDISTTKIVSFIEDKFEVELENHPNTKIEDDFIETIEAKFKKAETPKPLPKEEKNEQKPTSEPIIEEKENTIETEKKPLIETVVAPTESVASEIEVDTSIKLEVPLDMENVELIKAPKPKLKEIKVLRKIELPNLKKAEKAVEDEDNIENKSSITPSDVAQLEKELKESIEKPIPVKKKSTYKRPNKPTVKTKSVDEILAEKKRKEEKIRKEEIRKEKQRKEYEKKLKKEHYATQVKNIKPKKKNKKKKETDIIIEKKETQKENLKVG